MAMLDITTNVGCINKCLYCPQRSFTGEYKKSSTITRMTFEAFKACLDSVPHNVGLSFAGFSEPFLNPQCTEMLLYAYEQGYKCIHVSTTLVGVSGKDLDLLEKIPFDAFKVHLPGNSKHEEIKMGEDYMNVLDKLTKSNINASYHYHGKKLHPDFTSLIGNDAIRILTIPRSISIPDRVDISLVKKKRGAITCRYDPQLGFNELLPNGDVLLCCHDFSMKHPLGTLLSQNYQSLFNNQEFLTIKAGLTDDASEIICRYCLVSRNVNRDRAYYSNLLNTDVVILAYLAAKRLEKTPILGTRITRKLLQLLGINKFKIDFG